MRKAKDKGNTVLSGEAFTRQLAAYSLAAGAALMMVTPAEAAVKVFQPLLVNANAPFASLSMDASFGSANVYFGLASSAASSGAASSGDAGKLMAGGNAVQIVRHNVKVKASSGSTLSTGAVYNMKKSKIISTGATNVASYGALQSFRYTTVKGKKKLVWGKYAPFNNGKSGYIGVIFTDGSGVKHPGWIQFKAGKTPGGQVVEWAYEDKGNKIAVGSTKSLASNTSSLSAAEVSEGITPIARPGGRQVVQEGAVTVLDGSRSKAPAGIASYQWTQVSGPTVTLSGADTSTATFTAPKITGAKKVAGLVFNLTVTDKNGVRSSKICVVRVTPAQ